MGLKLPVPYDTCASCPNFTSTYYGVNACLALGLDRFLNVKALIGAFNQEKALVWTFSMIVNCENWLLPLDRLQL